MQGKTSTLGLLGRYTGWMEQQSERAMSRNDAAIIQAKNVDTKMHTLVRSAQANLNRSTSNHREHPRKTTKTRGSYLPKPKILRIQQRYINGQNKSEIAREEKCDRETVARIVQFPEVQDFIAQAQQEFFGLITDAMAAVRHALRVENNPTIGLAVLERTGVTAYRGERMQLPATTPRESGYERQLKLVGAVLLEANRQMGVPLGPEIEEALANDAGECVEAANVKRKPATAV
jgi:hypothetical protein